MDMSKVAFVGNSRAVVSWYRCALPALFSGADWFGVVPTDPKVVTTKVAKRSWAEADQYEVIVWQQPLVFESREMIRHLRSKGVKVIIEMDDYLPGVPKMDDHDFKSRPEFGKKAMQSLDKMISICDGLIVSTQFLADKYRHLKPDATYVCLNGLDLGRYAKGRPEHEGVNLGWAGATGHRDSFQRIAQTVADVLNAHPETTIVTIGQGFAEAYSILPPRDGKPRHMSLPFSSLEIYPNAMTIFDIALAPARNTGWYRAKSALRAYEAAALGIPVIGDPLVYSEVQHGVTGLLVEGEDDWRDNIELLVTDHDMRERMGRAAREWAWSTVDMRVRVNQWVEAIGEVAEA